MKQQKPQLPQTLSPASSLVGRRRFLRDASLAAASIALGNRAARAQVDQYGQPLPPVQHAPLPAIAPSLDPSRNRAPDFRIDIAEVEWELSPKKKVRTASYNSQIPGPLLRVTEGKPVVIDITNHLDRDEIVHWHGQWIPVAADGSMEEGSSMIPPGASARIAFTPRPSGLHWYHTHAMANHDVKRGLYSGQFGALYVEPRSNPGHYDQEQFLVLHDWSPYFAPSDDGSLMVQYDCASINGRMLGFDAPIQVREGQRVLFHIVNASATEVHWIALPGHAFQVIALDGAPVPTQATVPVLRLGPAERISAVVTMNAPGVWVLGEPRAEYRNAGMGVFVEYAGRSGKPDTRQSVKLQWDYRTFDDPKPVFHTPDTTIPLVFTSRFKGHGAVDQWMINGKSWPDTDPIQLSEGIRHRLVFVNRSMDDHPVHLHRHNFELVSINGAPTSGVRKDVVIVEAGKTVEADLIANNPGNTLFHCHQQDHMDAGFMALFRYV